MRIFKYFFDSQGSLRFFLKMYIGTYKYKAIHLLTRKILIRKYDIHLGYDTFFGEDINFPHPSSIVIGEKVRIGKGCTIYQGVTIGKDNNGDYPLIENNVIIYPNSTLIGKIVVRENSIIGANSFVNSSVQKNSIYAGNPAKKIGDNK